MFKTVATATTALGVIASLAICIGSAPAAKAQELGRQPVHFKVSGSVERLEMIVNTSRILTTEHKVPQLLVENQGVVRAQPISPNQVQLSALKPGFTTLTVWDENQGEHTIDVLVYGDARELENLLMTEFPEATLRVRPLASSVVISGYVPRAEMVSRIIRMAEDYYPSVINNVTIGGVQQVLLHVKLMEVSRTKLRQLGFDWAHFSGNDAVIQSVAGLVTTAGVGAGAAATSGGETLAFGIVNDANSFFGFIDALRQYNLVKVLAEPTLVTVSGRPASFNSGGEFPIPIPQGLGTTTIQFREFGTRVDFVPIVLGNGRIRLEVRPSVSELDYSRSVTLNGTTVPGVRTRWVDTGVEMKAGQTLALAGLIQTQVETENAGLPWLSDLPWLGVPFRKVRERNNEIELLVLVTPEFVEALDASEVPPCGPGQLTTSPSDTELYFRGYMEKPTCCPDGSCASCESGVGPATFTLPNTSGPAYEPVPAVRQPASFTDRAMPRNGNLPPRPPVAAAGPGATAPSLIGPTGYDALE
ncbi:MAG: pilus assembly protein N-terminal domain-containing protein [Planctomycetota bacterium]